jgi:branched-chain amino acid transport system ATP-binding protein
VNLWLRDVHTYYGPSHVLHGVSIDVHPGEIAALVGRNGVGKTTTLRSIMGLAPPASGSIGLGSKNITGWPPNRIARAGIGYVPEGRQIFADLTVRENLIVAERRGARRWTQSRLFELFPRLRERVGHRGRQLSGGEQQMLAIARALASEPSVMLLDEPTQGLAPLVVRELAAIMEELRREQVTVLLVEQNLRFVELVAQRIFIIVKGSVVHSAPAEKFRIEEAAIKQRYLAL